jgi:hypothetical protein
MHVEFFVEESSTEAFLEGCLKRWLPNTCSFKIHSFQGKRDLLASLPSRLRAYSQWAPEDYRFAVLVDEDRQDCQELKARLERAAAHAGMQTKSSAPAGARFKVVNRIAVEELEAWFFGDIDALVAAYPKVPRTLARKRQYRDPDHIAGGTWEALERVLQRAGYYPGGLPKIETARRMAPLMDDARNHSTSFQCFIRGLRALVA